MSKAMNMVGFALMKLPQVLDRAYEGSPMAREHRDQLQHLRQTFNTVEPAAYRGVERWALSESPQPDPGWSQTAPRPADEKASQRFLEILGGDHECDHYPCSLIPTLTTAQELMRAVDHPEEYEIVRLSRDAFSGGPMLGFDVGYWGGGNYSILCDSLIWPMWHGPPPEAFEDLARHIACLNTHMLFPDRQSAERFRSFYLTQSWAETEDVPGEFCVIGIDAVERPDGAPVR
jgi:hypothetical protein